MQWLDRTWVALVGAVADVGRCIRQPFSNASCDVFWPVVILLVIVAGFVGLILIARVFIRDYLAHRRAGARWRAEQEVAPPEVMEQSKWRGDVALPQDLSQSELTARIKEQIALNRADKEGPAKG